MAEEPLAGRKILAEMSEAEALLDHIMQTTADGDEDRILMSRGSIRKLAVCVNIVKGYDVETAKRLAEHYAKQLLDI